MIIKRKTVASLTAFILLLDVWLISQKTTGERAGCFESNLQSKINPQCISDVLLNDKIADCTDISYKLNCTNCEGGSFTCKSIGCVSWNFTCNAQPHCQDQSFKNHGTASNFRTPPLTWEETWRTRSGNNSRRWLKFFDQSLAFYSTNENKLPITWSVLIISSAWSYVKSYYGFHGPDPRLYVILQEDRLRGDVAGFSWKETRRYRNILYLKSPQSSSSQDKYAPGWFDNTSENSKTLLMYLVNSIRLGMDGTLEAADNAVCGNQINTILLLDVVAHLHRENLVIPSIDGLRVKSKHMCNDWFLTMYRKYGEQNVINQYFILTKIYWESHRYGPLNKGQLVHFWGGATGADLRPLARKILKWTFHDDDELNQAQKAMPFFIYPTSTDNSTHHYIPVRAFRKTWKCHNKPLNLAYADQHVAFYFQNFATYNVPIGAFQTISSAWKYVKLSYGPFGANSTIHFVLHGISRLNSKTKCFSSNENNYVDPEFTFRHVIDCPETIHGEWANTNEASGSFDEIFEEIGRMALKLCKGRGNWPAYNVSTWKMASILVYDMYSNLNRTKEARNWKTRMEEETPDDGKFWFKDWYLRIYEQHGGSIAINRFLSLLVARLKHVNGDFTRKLDPGEYLHFWNEAAGTNLQELSRNVMNWDLVKNLVQFSDARNRFPTFNYSCDDCDEFTGPNKSIRTKEGDIPKRWDSPNFNKSDTLWRVYLDEHVAVYTLRDLEPLIQVLLPNLTNTYKYILNTYGKMSFGSKPRLYILLHVNNSFQNKTTCSFRVFQTTHYGNRNVIECHIPTILKRPADLIATVLVTLIKERLNSVLNSADKHVCENEMTRIVAHDIRRYMTSTSIAGSYLEEVISGEDTYSRTKGVDWFKDWFLPIYQNYGGNAVLRRYYTLTYLYCPQTIASDVAMGHFNTSFNVGEFVHFWSGAAGKDLQYLATASLSWSAEDHAQKVKARIDFPLLHYNYTDESETVNLPSRTLSFLDNGQAKTLILRYNDEHTAFYGTQPRPHNADLFRTVSSAWAYAKNNYRINSNSFHFLNIALQTENVTGSSSCFPSIRSFRSNKTFDDDHKYDLTISCTIAPLKRHVASVLEIHGAFDKYVIALSRQILRLTWKNNRTGFYWPGKEVSGWSMSNILVYDIYLELNKTEEANQWASGKSDESDSVPSNKTFWFRDWYSNIYNRHGKSTVLNNFFKLLKDDLYQFNQTVANQMLTMGEFVHLWSAAAQVDLRNFARITVDWDRNQLYQAQFIQARISMPGMNYSCNNCDENIDEPTPKLDNPVSETDTNMIVVGVSASILIVVIFASGYKFLSYNKRIESLQTRFLTPEEVTEFVDGNQNVDPRDAHAPIHSLPFNPEFEVAQDRLVIDETLVLGSGEFGLVKKGILKAAKENEGADVVVAVKMVKPNVEVVHFKALLSEIKIMAHLGQHQNIASLLGTLTQNIINCQVFIAIEFCLKGDVLRYLQDNVLAYQNYFETKIGKDSRCTFKNDSSKKVKIEPLRGGSSASSKSRYINSPVTTLDLLEWSRQIACGMAYLGSKHVIHGDLAARNVLLTEYNIAKISDFGLSRQLAKYSIYSRNPETPVPWRWLAPEALERRTFSIHSDIWSFGVTLWEIFTLGKVPYSSRAWDRNFVNDLLDGERLSSPEFGNKEIYEIMLDCMKKRPTERIQFTHISSKLQKITETLISTERNRHYLSLEGSD